MISQTEWQNMSHMERMGYLNCKPIPLPPLTDLCINKWNEEHVGDGSKCCINEEEFASE